MYTFTHQATGKTHSYTTLHAASKAKERMDQAYGRVITTYPRFVEAPTRRVS